MRIRGLVCDTPQARQMGNVHTACQATEDLHDVKKNIFVSVYQNIPTLYRIIKTCSFIQTTVSNLCTGEPILDPKQLYTTIKKCKNILKTGTIIRKDTKEHIQVPLEQEYRYQYYIMNGTIIPGVTDHTCSKIVDNLIITGEGTDKLVMYQKEDHLKMISIQINLTSVEITVTEGLVQDNTGQIFSPSCISKGECIIQGHPYILNKTIKYPCNLARIQTEVEFTLVPGAAAKYVSQHSRTILEISNKTRYCENGPGIYLETQYKQVVAQLVTPGGEHSDQDLIEPRYVNSTVYHEMREDYKHYLLKKNLEAQVRNLAGKTCSILNTMDIQSQVSVYHGDSRMRIQGDMLVEETCTAVLLEVREFEVRNEACYADSLPVYLRNKPMYLTGKHHLVVKNPGVNQIDCNKKFLPIYSDINNRYVIQATPGISIKKLDDKFHRGYLHPEKPEESKTSTGASSIHYDKSDLKTYNTIVNLKRVQQDILTTLVYKYCQDNPMKICEDITSLNQSEPFQLRQLEKGTPLPWDYVKEHKTMLMELGSISGLVLGVLYLGDLVWKSCRTLAQAMKYNLSLRRSLKLNFRFQSTILDDMLTAPLLPVPCAEENIRMLDLSSPSRAITRADTRRDPQLVIRLEAPSYQPMNTRSTRSSYSGREQLNQLLPNY